MDNKHEKSKAFGSLLTIEGVVEDIIYTNEQNGYTVCMIDRDGEPVTVVGVLPFLNEGERITATGSWTYHASFGRQFKVEHYEKQLPADENSILMYLSSGAIKGIGPVTARRIYDKFGTDSLDVLENRPDWLAAIKGISPNKARQIGESYASQFGVRNIMMYFNGLMSPALSFKIYKRWGAASVDIVKNNPFILCEEIYGIGFDRADRIASALGVEKNSKERLCSGVKYVLRRHINRNGHCFLPMERLIFESASLLEAETDDIENAVGMLSARGEVNAVKFPDMTAVYLERMYHAERYCAQKLLLLLSAAIIIPIKDGEKIIDDVEREINIQFAPLQRKAIRCAVNQGICIVTGGPGTGKTTVIRAILRIFDRLEIETVLAAPTGRAAKRMSAATDREAKTIHRLLESEFGSDNFLHFHRNEDNPLDAGAVIIDETSMADITLMEALLKALKPGTKLILIGDSDQLPPVGAGDALRDMLRSGVFESVELNEIFRQSQDSMIVLNAHRINKGEPPLLDNRAKDFFFLSRNARGQVPDAVCELCSKRLPDAYGFDPNNEIQVISPTRRGEGGTVYLNAVLQACLNPRCAGKHEKTVRDTIFREGDKVMQIRNNYSQEWESGGKKGSGVYNGDIGVIERIDEYDETFAVRFDEKKVRYDFSQFEEIEHAFAVTVHKSQGSEYPAVIIPLYDAPPSLLTRNMLYTAVTRAQSLVVLVGNKHIVAEMAANNRQFARYTGLEIMLAHGKDARGIDCCPT